MRLFLLIHLQKPLNALSHMKKQFVNLALIAFIALGATSCKDAQKDATSAEAKEVIETAEAATAYTIDTSKSVITWTGSKPAGSHTGTLHLKEGSLNAVKRDIQSGDFTIDMNSLTNTDLEGGMKESLEGHLKGTVEGKEKDFFSVTEYPTAAFELTGVTGTNGKITVEGNLTIKGKTQNVSFPATVSFPGDTVFLKSEAFMIDRTQWDINFMSKSVFDDLKDKFIDDEIELTVELHGTKA